MTKNDNHCITGLWLETSTEKIRRATYLVVEMKSMTGVFIILVIKVY